MAWSTPKTNWNAADGVRDTDFNRIEGNMLELYNSTALRSGITVYVSTAGNDSTGTGTSAAPYRTITRALASIPKNLDGKSATINIAAGVYAEDVRISHYTGPIRLTGVYDASVTIDSLVIEACSVQCNSIHLRVIAGGVTLAYGAVFICQSKLTVNDSERGLAVHGGSTCIINAALNVSFSTIAAIEAMHCSRVYVLQLTVSDSTVVADIMQGSILAYGSTNLTVNSITFRTSTGGRIYTGAQLNL